MNLGRAVLRLDPGDKESEKTRKNALNEISRLRKEWLESKNKKADGEGPARKESLLKNLSR